MNLKKWYMLAALIITAPTVQASQQQQVKNLAEQPASVATFTQLATALKFLGTNASQLPFQIRQSIQNKYNVDVVTIVQMEPAKITALASLETAWNNYKAAVHPTINEAEDLIKEAQGVGNITLITKIFGDAINTDLSNANNLITTHNATTRTTSADAITALRAVADKLQEIEPTTGHGKHVDAVTDDTEVITNTQYIARQVNVDVYNAKVELNDLCRGGALSLKDARGNANPAVFNSGDLDDIIKKTFAEQVQDIVQPRRPHITITLNKIALLNGIRNVDPLLDPTITPTPDNFNDMKTEAQNFIDWSYYAIQQTDTLLERIATPFAPAFTLPANETLVNRTSALLTHLAGPGARSATLDAYLDGLKPHGTPLATSCGLDATHNATGNTAQIITDVNTALGYMPVNQAAGVKAMQYILSSLNLDYAGLTTTDQKVEYVIKKLLFDQYKTFMWLTKNSGTPGTDYLGTPAITGVGNIAQARITQLNNALRDFHARTGGAVLPTGQDHQLITLTNGLETALNTKLTSCTNANLFISAAEVNIPNFVIAVNEMKDVITTLAPAGFPTAAGTTPQLIDAIKQNIGQPLIENYIKANNVATSFIDYTSVMLTTPHRNKIIQNNIKEMTWALQSLASAAKLKNGTALVPAPAAFDATTYAGIPSIAAGDKLNKNTLVQDIINGIQATAPVPTTLATPFYTGLSDISNLLNNCTAAILARPDILSIKIGEVCSIIHDLGNGIPGGSTFSKKTLTNHLKNKQYYDYAAKINTARTSGIVFNSNTFNDPNNYEAGLEDIRNLFPTSAVTIAALPAPFVTTWNPDTFKNQVREVIGGTIVLLNTIDTIAVALGTTPRIQGTPYSSLGDLFKQTQETLASITTRARSTSSAAPAASSAVIREVAEHNAAVDSIQIYLNIYNNPNRFTELAGSSTGANLPINTAFMEEYNKLTANRLFFAALSTSNQYAPTPLGRLLGFNDTATPVKAKGTYTALFKNQIITFLPTIQQLQQHATSLKATHATETVKTFTLTSSGANWSIPTPLPTAPAAIPNNLMITTVNA